MLGLWVIASPWLLGFAHTKAMAINVGIGLSRRVHECARATG